MGNRLGQRNATPPAPRKIQGGKNIRSTRVSKGNGPSQVGNKGKGLRGPNTNSVYNGR